MNLAYFLKDGEVASRPATDDEVRQARETATKRLEADGADYAIRTCWNCNPSHSHFLERRDDGFLFNCMMGCGRWYYQGVDFTIDDDPDEKAET